MTNQDCVRTTVEVMVEISAFEAWEETGVHVQESPWVWIRRGDHEGPLAADDRGMFADLVGQPVSIVPRITSGTA